MVGTKDDLGELLAKLVDQESRALAILRCLQARQNIQGEYIQEARAHYQAQKNARQLGNIESALGNHNLAAEFYKQHIDDLVQKGQPLLAANFSERIGLPSPWLFSLAAKKEEQDGNYPSAAICYLKAYDFEKAMLSYELSGFYLEAFNLAKLLKNEERARTYEKLVALTDPVGILGLNYEGSRSNLPGGGSSGTDPTRN